jgi:uncharacterized protein with NRDE domain
MCLIAWNWQPQSETPLLLLGNRDEFYARPTQALHWWDGEQVLAGKDLEAGGTWLGVGVGGRLAALTNFRLPQVDPRPKPSRGAVTARFLQSDTDARSYLQALAAEADQYNPFNLLLWDGHALLGLESRHRHIRAIAPGIGAVSNADFDTPWPKLQRLKAGLDQSCASGATAVQDLLPLLQERQIADDSELPKTGVPLDVERMLSAIFVASPTYGTRASSIVTVRRNTTHFFEQSYTTNGMFGTTQQFSTH